jgi:hypothetical protein
MQNKQIPKTNEKRKERNKQLPKDKRRRSYPISPEMSNIQGTIS